MHSFKCWLENYVTLKSIKACSIYGLPSLNIYPVKNAPVKPIACKIYKSVISKVDKLRCFRFKHPTNSFTLIESK